MRKLSRNWITWNAYILLAMYAYFLNILGPITPFLHDELRISYTVSSLHFSAFAVGILVVGFAGHISIRKIGYVQALSLGAIGVGSGALLLVASRSPIISIFASFLTGCVGSLILAVVPTLLSQEHNELCAVAISEANVLSSLVASFASLLVGWFAGLVVGWRLALILAALLSIGMGIKLFQPHWSPNALQDSGNQRRSLPVLFWWYWVALILAVSIEFCMIFWSADYMELALKMARNRAVQTVSLFLVGMICGRLACSWLLRLLSAYRIVLASILLGILGFLLFWRASDALSGMAGLAITGLGVASLYPVILSLAINTAGNQAAEAGARATLASGVAILLLPLILGWMADITTLHGSFSIVAVLFAFVLLMMLTAYRKTPEKRKSEHSIHSLRKSA